jgi:hypothetical protein
VKLAFVTDDIAGTVAAWRAKGVDFIRIPWSSDPSGIADSPYGPFIAFRDPSGNVHELLQPDEAPRETPTWRHTDLSATAGAPGAAGEPVTKVTPDGTLHVLYRGVDEHIHEIRS